MIPARSVRLDPIARDADTPRRRPVPTAFPESKCGNVALGRRPRGADPPAMAATIEDELDPRLWKGKVSAMN
jgi:hypothetical protein